MNPNTKNEILKQFHIFCGDYLTAKKYEKQVALRESFESWLEDKLQEVERDTERRTAQKILDKWNNDDGQVSFSDWLKNYILIKSQLKGKS